MADSRELLRQWLRSIERTKGTTLSGIARDAKVAQSTITRFVNDPDYPYDLSRRTIRKIEDHYGMPAPTGRTFAEAAPADFRGQQKPGKSVPVAREWVMARDNALDLRGVREGDLCEVDHAVQPLAGDLVQAELRAGFKNRETAIRIFDPPYLMAHSTTYDLNRPILIEPGRAKVVGVVTKISRQVREPDK